MFCVLGYLLLAGRVRSPAEEQVIREVLQKHLKRAVNPTHLFTLSTDTSPTTAPLLGQVTVAPPAGFEHVVWTYSMRRMAVLVGQALKFGEPVLLVGDTGYVEILVLYNKIQNFKLKTLVLYHINGLVQDCGNSSVSVKLYTKDICDLFPYIYIAGIF